MKVSGPSGTTSATPSRPARTGGGGFSLPSGGAQPVASAAPAGSTAGVTGVTALMALQGVEDAVERRRRAIRRGGGLLDRLDDLKLAMLAGGDGAAALAGLARAVREARTDGDDPALGALLDQIDLRAAVELAKAGVRAA